VCRGCPRPLSGRRSRRRHHRHRGASGTAGLSVVFLPSNHRDFFCSFGLNHVHKYTHQRELNGSFPLIYSFICICGVLTAPQQEALVAPCRGGTLCLERNI